MILPCQVTLLTENHPNTTWNWIKKSSGAAQMKFIPCNLQLMLRIFVIYLFIVCADWKHPIFCFVFLLCCLAPTTHFQSNWDLDDCAGQGRMNILCCLFPVFDWLDLWSDALSSCKVQWSEPTNLPIDGSSCCSSVLTHFSELVLPSKKAGVPIPW